MHTVFNLGDAALPWRGHSFRFVRETRVATAINLRDLRHPTPRLDGGDQISLRANKAPERAIRHRDAARGKFGHGYDRLQRKRLGANW